MFSVSLLLSLSAPAIAQISTSITSTPPSATLIADERVTEANGALTAAVVGVSNCDSTFVIQCFNKPICSLHGPATVTQGPSNYESQWVYNTPGGTASHSESCIFSSVPGIASCFGYTTITASSNQASVISSAFTVAVEAYQVPITQGADSLATPWSICTPIPTATPTSSSVGSDSHEGLSTGAQAGIGVGVGIAVALLLGITLFCFVRRRKGRAAEAQIHQDEKLGQMSSSSHVSQNSDGKGLAELHEEYRLPQLPTMPQQLYGSETAAPRYELPAGETK